MFTLKAFATHSQLVSNALGTVSPIGELSTRSLTFAREKGQFASSVLPAASLVTFTSKQDSSAIVTPSNVLDHVQNVVKGVYDYVFAQHGTIFTDATTAYLSNQFNDVLSGLACGAIVNNGTYYAPEWVSWTNTSISGLGQNTIKVWFSDASFQSQYDDYELVVIAPILNMNDFFKTPSEVQAAVSALTGPAQIDRVQAAKVGYPETVLRAETFDYVDPFNATHKIPVTWYVLIYGDAGNNIDVVVEAMILNALANSTRTREQWTLLIPSLFKRTEFTIIPGWDQYAIPNLSIQAGIYSPVFNLQRALALIKQVLVNFVSYPEVHINNHATIMAHPYKSLQLLFIGSPENRDSMYEITDVFSDIIAVGTASTDFNRMHSDTKEFLLFLAEMLVSAETLLSTGTVPAGYTKTTRLGMQYIVKRYNNINYLMSAKGNTATVITGE